MVESSVPMHPRKSSDFLGTPFLSSHPRLLPQNVCDFSGYPTFRGNFAIPGSPKIPDFWGCPPPGESYAKFKTLQTPPWHCFLPTVLHRQAEVVKKTM